MKLIAYYRASTTKQGAEGYGVDAQRSAVINAVATRPGDEVITEHAEVASGGSLNRRVLLRHAMNECDSGHADGIIVARLDRLSRSLADFSVICERARRKGWVIVCLDPPIDMATPFGEAMGNMAATFAQLEHRLISQRQRESVAARRAAGTYTTTPPEMDRVVLRRIKRLYADGGSRRSITKQLAKEGYKSPRGKPWAASTVWDAIRREGYERSDDQDVVDVVAV